MWFPQLEQRPHRKTLSINKNHLRRWCAQCQAHASICPWVKKVGGEPQCILPAYTLPQKRAKSRPCQMLSRFGKNCNLGKLIIFACNKCKMLNKWEWIFVWSGCRQVEHQRSLSPSLCKQIKVENKTVSTQRNNVNRISLQQDLNQNDDIDF